MKFPWLASAVVTLAVAVMIGLGVWQLQRAEWKRNLLARYDGAGDLPPVAWPSIPPRDPEQLYFRRASGFCLEVTGWRSTAGRNRQDQTGWSHIASCRTGAEGPGMQVDVGWSTRSDPPQWRGGQVSGIIAADSKYGLRLIAAEPAPGLAASAPPDRESISNNHLLYAIQWFLFAATAAIVYLIALRRRRREGPGPAVDDGSSNR